MTRCPKRAQRVVPGKIRGQAWLMLLFGFASLAGSLLLAPIVAAASDPDPVPFSASELFERSVAAVEPFDEFFARWEMTMSLTMDGGPAPGVEDFVTEMQLWMKEGKLRHETRMPDELLAEVPPPDAATAPSEPLCITIIVRDDSDFFYCQTFDGQWQTHALDDVDPSVTEIPHFLTGSPEDMGITFTGLETDKWGERDAWRIDGDLEEAVAAAELPPEVDTSISLWIDRDSLLLLATKTWMNMPEASTGSAGTAFVMTITMEVVEFDPEVDIPDALFEPSDLGIPSVSEPG